MTVFESLLDEASRCTFCGFCEHVCPTLIKLTRNYGPRGRVNTIVLALKNNLITEESIKGIYTCLVCGACTPECPAGIRIHEVIREFRHLMKKMNALKGAN
jgi:glycolate oxidase iron-sulfur subunit